MTRAAQMRITGAAVVLAAGCIPAAADFVGLETEMVDWGDGLISHRVFAVFDGPADRLLGVVGTPALDMVIQTDDPAGFFQIDPGKLGADTAPSQLFIDIFPDLVMDSWVTLGLDAGFVGADDTLLTPGWFLDGVSDGFNLNGIIGPTDEGWVNGAPDNGAGDPDVDGRVLVGQFTVGQGFSVEGFDMTVGWIDLDVGGDTILSVTDFLSGDSPPAQADLIAFQVLVGVLTGGDLNSVSASDDDYMTIDGVLNNQGSLWRAAVKYDLSAAIDTGTDLTVSVEVAIDDGATAGRLFMRNWTTGQFQLVAGPTLTAIDTVVEVSVDPNLFLQAGTGNIQIRLSSAVPVADDPDNYELRFDHVTAVVTP